MPYAEPIASAHTPLQTCVSLVLLQNPGPRVGVFSHTEKKPWVLLLNVFGSHIQGSPYLEGQTPPQGPSGMAMFPGTWWKLVQMAVT